MKINLAKSRFPITFDSTTKSKPHFFEIMKQQFVIIFLVGILFSCSSRQSVKTWNKVEILPQLIQQKKGIDTLFQQRKGTFLVFAKQEDSLVPVQIFGTDFPENIATTYNILKDRSGKIVRISEMPYSETGDWQIIYNYYFDTLEKTFAFEKQTDFFNSLCTPGIAHEKETIFYDSNFQKLDSAFSLVDENYHRLKKDSCDFPYDYPYKISSNLSDYLQRNQLNTVQK